MINIQPQQGKTSFATLRVGLVLVLVVGCGPSAAPEGLAPADREMMSFGYGLESKASSGASVSTIPAGELDQGPVAQLEELLVARVPGVQVMTTAAGGFVVRIRGASTLSGRSDPLYVVDGMPVRVEPNRGIDWLNPADVARIDVLKDAASTSLYGMRGANGVIVITTREAR